MRRIRLCGVLAGMLIAFAGTAGSETTPAPRPTGASSSAAPKAIFCYDLRRQDY